MNVFIKKILIAFAILFGILALLVGLLWLFFGRGPAQGEAGSEAAEMKWGAGFDPYYAEYLGLDWKETFVSLLDDVGVNNFRLVAFWDAIEPDDDQFDFERLDFQMEEAAKRGAKVILSIGKRLPRWPECHAPSWAQNLSREEEKAAIMDYLDEVINRYKDSSALEYWQVENEPYVWFFGECGKADIPLVEDELAYVKSLDPNHPRLVTESGEMSTWYAIARLGDHIGISVYEVIYAQHGLAHFFPGYRQYVLPPWSYRAKANFYKWLGWIDEIFISELQAEPWGPKPLTEMTLEEQYRSFNPDLFRQNIAFAQATGFPRAYLWGAEWWFHAREKYGVGDFIEIAGTLWD